MQNDAMKYIFPILIGYFLGSFLPGYFLPLWLKKVDIRNLGDGNPGVINVKRTIGMSLAVATAIYDISKGLISMLIAFKIFGAPNLVIVLAGFASILGHKYPFYLKFKGGRGIAATVGIFLFLLVKVMVESFTIKDMIFMFLYIGTYAFLVRMATHDEDFFTITMLPIFAGILAFKVKSFSELTLVLILMGMIFYESSKNLKFKMFTLSSEKYTLWRIFARPLALLFIFLGLIISKETLLILIGSVLLSFFLFDLSRILIPKFEKILDIEILPDIKLIREREKGKISSMTNFLLGVFLSFLLFDKSVAYASLGFLSLGDMFSKIVGINYGKIHIFKNGGKTVEGSLAFFSASISIVYFLWIANLLSLWVGIVGAIVATFAELIPSQIDDNLSIPTVSGAVMELLQKLFF